MRVKDIIAASQWRPSPRYGVDRPRVSVLLPTFCRGQSGLFLRSARSVLDQSLAELELIIVDDASTDGTAGQIAELLAQDDRVSLLRHPRNVGLPAVSEYEAFLKARAEYLAFAFDDDEFYPSALAELLAGLQAGNHSIVHGTVDLLAYDPILRRKTKTCLGREKNGQTLLHATNYIPNNAVLLHRRVVDEVGFYDPHAAMSRLCDWDLWRRVAECFPIVPLEVRVGTVSGPATADSLGRTRLLDQWQSTEWVALPRNEQLKPGAMEEYDVLALPGGLSAGAALAAQEIGETFRDKFWFPKSPPCPGDPGTVRDPGTMRSMVGRGARVAAVPVRPRRPPKMCVRNPMPAVRDRHRHLVARDPAVDHADRAVRVGRHARIVRHQQHRDPLGVELLEHPQNLHAGLGVEVPGRLVGQQERGLVDQCPGDGHPLLLAAGHLRRLVIIVIGQAEPP
jgi:hypothetical protein